MPSFRKIVKVTGAVMAVLIILGVVVAVRTFGSGNLSKARRIAAQLQAAAIANPNPVATPAPATAPTVDPASTATAAPAGAAASAGAAALGKPSSATSTTGAKGARATSAASPATSAKAATAPAATAASPKAPVAVTTLARRQPTAAEVNQAIIGVHSLLPFFTPTAADIASAGNQACTAFDQGQTLAQVESVAIDMVGAGSVAWMIPASVPQVAIQTLVALYCPGHWSQVA